MVAATVFAQSQPGVEECEPNSLAVASCWWVADPHEETRDVEGATEEKHGPIVKPLMGKPLMTNGKSLMIPSLSCLHGH